MSGAPSSSPPAVGRFTSCRESRQGIERRLTIGATRALMRRLATDCSLGRVRVGMSRRSWPSETSGITVPNAYRNELKDRTCPSPQDAVDDRCNADQITPDLSDRSSAARCAVVSASSTTGCRDRQRFSSLSAREVAAISGAKTARYRRVTTCHGVSLAAAAFCREPGRMRQPGRHRRRRDCRSDSRSDRCLHYRPDALARRRGVRGQPGGVQPGA